MEKFFSAEDFVVVFELVAARHIVQSDSIFFLTDCLVERV
jgi:hypothetical protein